MIINELITSSKQKSVQDTVSNLLFQILAGKYGFYIRVPVPGSGQYLSIVTDLLTPGDRIKIRLLKCAWEK